jgi:hypothetical protein
VLCPSAGVEADAAAFKEAMQEADARAHCHFSKLGEGAFTEHLDVQLGIALADLTDRIAEHLAVPRDSIALHESDGRLVTYIQHTRRSRILVKAATAATAGQAKRAHVLPVYLYKGDREDFSAKLLDLEVDSQWTVAHLKLTLAQKIRAGAPSGSALAAADAAALRVRRVGWSGMVMLDAQTVSATIKHFMGHEKLGVTLLPGPEEKTEAGQVVVSVARWKPSEYALGDHAELVVANQCSCADFRAKLAALLAAELGRDVAAADVGLAKKGYNVSSVFDLPNADWDADLKQPVAYKNYQGTMVMPAAPDQSIGHLVGDDATFFFRLNAEPLKELAPAERAALEKVQKRLAAKRRGGAARREEGIKITVAGAPLRRAAVPLACFPPLALRAVAAGLCRVTTERAAAV